MATTYALVIDGTTTDFVRSTKATVVKEADNRIARREGYKAQVVTSGGKVVHTVSRRKITKFTPPYTKVIEVPEDLKDLVPAGYAAAYARYRNGAIVLRRESDIVEDPSRYAVISIVAKSIAGYAATTRDAGQIMKSLKK
jgi:hypothetical protein